MAAVEIISYILPILTGVVSWFAGRRVRENSTLQKMQETIDILVARNSKLVEQVTMLQEKNIKLEAGQDKMLAEIEHLRLKLSKQGK